MVKCPKCGKEVDEWIDECPYCKTNFTKYDKGETSDRNHAYWLNIFAVINIILCIISSIIVFINYSTTEVVKDYNYLTGTSTETVINWLGILGGIAILITGFTIFFTLETIIDIHDMTEEINDTTEK